MKQLSILHTASGERCTQLCSAPGAFAAVATDRCDAFLQQVQLEFAVGRKRNEALPQPVAIHTRGTQIEPGCLHDTQIKRQTRKLQSPYVYVPRRGASHRVAISTNVAQWEGARGHALAGLTAPAGIWAGRTIYKPPPEIFGVVSKTLYRG